MDSGTHLAIGLGLAGLAHLDPNVASNMNAATAVFIGTVLGSQAPDFDSIFRIKGNAAYIKNHRGITHSLPAILIWTLLLTSGIKLFFPNVAWMTIGLWVFIAVVLHILSDVFNAYGTQALRPFTDRWISLNIIHIFDPIIFGAHVVAIVLWLLRIATPQVIFPILYLAILLYCGWRAFNRAHIQKLLPTLDKDVSKGSQYVLIPTVHPTHWNVIRINSRGNYELGEYKQQQLSWIDHVTCSDHPAVVASKQHPEIASFLYFSAYACAETQVHSWGYEVLWIDVRYRHRKQYPFVGVLLMNLDYEPIDCYVGWLSEERIGKKLRMDSYS